MFCWLLVIVGVASNVLSFELVCPAPPYRRLRAKHFCNGTPSEYYSCLFDEHRKQNIESCSEAPDFVRPGQKYVYSGIRKNVDCSVNRYQPFVFWPSVLSQCVFYKSLCNEIGQFSFTNGSTVKDRRCQCDFKKGYYFFNKLQQDCSCLPTEEDCTCVQVSCMDNSQDNELCKFVKGATISLKCQSVEILAYNRSTEIPPTHAESDILLPTYSSTRPVVILLLVSVVISVFLIIAVCKLDVIIRNLEHVGIWWKCIDSTEGGIGQCNIEIEEQTSMLDLKLALDEKEAKDTDYLKFELENKNSPETNEDTETLDEICSSDDVSSTSVLSGIKTDKILSSEEKDSPSKNENIETETGTDHEKDFCEFINKLLPECNQDPAEYIEVLNGLNHHVQCLKSELGADDIWKKQLAVNKDIHHFFGALILVTFSNDERLKISEIIQSLNVTSDEMDFPGKTDVYHWIQETKHDNYLQDPTKCDMKCIDDFLSQVNNLHQTSIKTNSDSAGVLSMAIQKLFTNLSESNDLNQYLFVLSMAILLDYNVKDKMFASKSMLTQEKLEEFVIKVKTAYGNLNKHLQNNSSKLVQAFLFHFLICNIRDTVNKMDVVAANKKIISALRITDILENLKHLGLNADQDLLSYLSGSDIDETVKSLENIIDGKERRKHVLSWKYFVNLPEHPLKESIKWKGVVADKLLNKNEGHKYLNFAFRNIIHQMCLEEVFPGKISLQKILSMQDDICLSPSAISDIPWAVLKYIVHVNSDFREGILYKLQKQFSSDSENDNENLLAEMSMGDDYQVDQRFFSFHPTDIFLAIYQCCDPFLKKLIATKMALCQFAIPLIYTDFYTNKIVLSTWSLSDIVLFGQSESVTASSTKIISFIRIGDGMVLSKSKMINQFLRNDEHPTFIHRDCHLGVNLRNISKGILEISWFNHKDLLSAFAPSQRTSAEKSTETIAVLNLRGEGNKNERQLEFLYSVSNVIVLMVACKDLQQTKFRSMLADIHKSKAHVILLTDIHDNAAGRKNAKQYLEKVKADYNKTKVISTLTNERLRTSSELKEILRKNISTLLSVSGKGSQLNDLSLPKGIYAAESKKCIRGKSLADEIFILLEKCEIAERWKEVTMPLQGNVWHEICKMEKELKRAKYEKFQENGTLSKKMRQFRLQQTEMLDDSPTPISHFVQTLLRHSDDHELLLYFISWFRQYLDSQSRKISHKLLKEFSNAFQEHETSKESKAEHALNLTERKLTFASFGLEHFFREIGQIYEAFVYTKTELKYAVTLKTQKILDQLPVVIAKLLLSGQPFELMDGDAAGVPLKWIHAVLIELDKLIPETRIVTISVLGVQSSGKSTLLNTMFGLQFSVSSGRCTRGIYLQLLPVKRKGLSLDFVLVLDTEGLRAPELSGEKVNHDNELATLVIGLADVVILNLKGETISEMENVLQIVINALLRLKQANKKLELRQSSIFVHQNVSEDVRLQLLQGQRKVVQNLNRMTKDVALEMHIADIEYFSDVIKFNPTEDVRYVAELFFGSPPMAPVSQKYSEAVISVSQTLFKRITSTIRPSRILNFYLHFQSLWYGIQAEDFIFSFRNILEIKSYSILESEFQRLIWDLEESKLQWMTDHIKPSFKKYHDVQGFANCAKQLTKECTLFFNEKHTDIDSVFKDFIDRNELRDYMVNYDSSKRNSIRAKAQEIIFDVIQNIKQEERLCAGLISNEKLLADKEKHINEKARTLAIELSGKLPTSREMTEKFEILWNDVINDIAPETPEKTQIEELEMMKTEIESALHQMYSQNSVLVKNELTAHQIDKCPTLVSLPDSLKLSDIKKGHVSFKSTWNSLKSAVVGSDNVKLAALLIINDIFDDIELWFEDLLGKATKYNISQFNYVLNLIRVKFKAHNNITSESHFNLTAELEIFVALHAAKYCYNQFRFMNAEYDQKHGLRAHLQACKKGVSEMFTDTCKGEAEVIIATNVLCNELKSLIQEKLERNLNLKIQRDVVQRFNHRKHHLMKYVMEYLADKGKFDDYIKYINNPEGYVKKLLKNLAQEMIFKKDIHGNSSFMDWVEVNVTSLIEDIGNAARISTSKCSVDISEWLQCFRCEIETRHLCLVLKQNSFQLVADHRVENFEDFFQNISQKLSLLKTQIIEASANVRPEDLRWSDESPYECMFTFLWGCKEKCPWCFEPCQRSEPNHGSAKDCHTCLQHRPNVIRGTSDMESKEVSLESCNFDVQSTLSRHCGIWCGCNENHCNVYHKCSEYKTYMNEWDIEPLADMSNSIYWNRFISTYIESIADHYTLKVPEIPESWKLISKEDAINSLSEVFLVH